MRVIDSGRSMTTEELAGCLYVEQGYLVVGTIVQCSVGERIFNSGSCLPGRLQVVRVIAPSSFKEWRQQSELAASLGASTNAPLIYEHFYRVESD
jgi:hypothetical protein